MDEAAGEELERREAATRVRGDVMAKIRRYNAWVDEVREQAEQWRPHQPRVGKRVPFANSNLYYSRDEKDLERYPELAAIEAEADKQEEVDTQLNKYYKPK